MDFNVIREYLVSKNIVGENVFFLEKPEKVTCTDYVIYTFKELDGGNIIRHYQLDIRCVSKEPLQVIEIKDKVINALDIYYKFCKINNEQFVIRSIKLLNGGGTIKNEEKGEYNALVYFYVTI